MRRIHACTIALLLSTPAIQGGVLISQDDVYKARDKVLPALVHIQPVVKDFNTGELKKQSVVGSGVIFHPDGYVVTNFHVAGKSERIVCTLDDKEQVTAELIGGDPSTDLAVIRLDLSSYKGKLTVAEFGSSDSIQVGQQVMALGSPLSLARSVSIGVISTKDRFFAGDMRLPTGEKTGRYNLWIQTDAAINPGNSGGPLVDMRGKIIGINSRAAFLANNIGFAIPSNVVLQVTRAIMADGSVRRSWIGVEAQALQELESFFGTDGLSGVLVSSVDPESPAEAAGIGAGDIILAIAGQPVSARYVEELPAFYSAIAAHTAGIPIPLRVRRGEGEQELSVTPRHLGELLGDDFEATEWDCTVKGITQQMRIENQLKDSLGVMVTGVKSLGLADLAGMRRGDVIVDVAGTPVRTLAEFQAVYEQFKDSTDARLLCQLKRGNALRFAAINMERQTRKGTGPHAN